jgi:tRNA pseudouridine55 synthase
MRPGFHLIHKPIGATSFELVKRFMDEIAKVGLSKQLPVCHGGALDPFAEGLVLILTGQATRLMDLVHAAPKSYVAQVAWGAETDTGDHLGKAIARGDANALDPASLDVALAGLLGWHDQVPPATSNKRVDGERAYRKAHRGEVVELPPSQVYLHAARWTAHDLPRSSTLELTSRGGFYVRALARDLGRALGVPAHLAGLHRTAIGPWRDPDAGAEPWIHGRELVPWLPARTLDDAEAARLAPGVEFARGTVEPPGWTLPGYPMPETPVRALHHGRLVALLEPKGEGWTASAIFRGGL